MDELIALVASYPRDNVEVAIHAADMAAFRGYYAKLLYEVPDSCCDSVSAQNVRWSLNRARFGMPGC